MAEGVPDVGVVTGGVIDDVIDQGNDEMGVEG